MSISLSYLDGWYPDEINDGHLDLFFFMLSGVMVFNILLIFLPIAYFYKYVSHVGVYSKASGSRNTIHKGSGFDNPLYTEHAADGKDSNNL